MRGFILAAGFGTRLRPITDHLPKALVPLAGKPLLGHAIDFLHEHGFSTIAANSHYRAEAVSAYITRSHQPCELFHETPEIRGTGGALDFARWFLGGEDAFIVINVDIFARFNLSEHIMAFLHSNESCRLLAFGNNTGTGTVRYDPATTAYLGTSVDAAPPQSGATADFIGMTLYRREFLELATPDDFSVLPMWQRARERGMRVTVGVINDGYWRDIGTPQSLARAHFDCIDGLHDLPPPEGCIIDRDRKLCYPISWQSPPANFGSHCWIEEPGCAITAPVERTVVLRGAAPGAVDTSLPVRSILFTPWGNVPFNE